MRKAIEPIVLTSNLERLIWDAWTLPDADDGEAASRTAIDVLRELVGAAAHLQSQLDMDAPTDWAAARSRFRNALRKATT